MRIKILIQFNDVYNRLKEIENFQLSDNQIFEIANQIFDYINKYPGDFVNFINNFTGNNSKIDYNRIFPLYIDRNQISYLNTVIAEAAASIYFSCFDTGMFNRPAHLQQGIFEIFPEEINKDFCRLNIFIE